MSNDVLSYLQGDSQGAKRDMIARCYYEVAQGDPKSGPVAFAVLLDACAEQFARTPKELADATVRFDGVMAQVREFERRLIERVEKSNASVVAAFKDETARARDAWSETMQQANRAGTNARETANEMKPVIAATKEIGRDLRELKANLQTLKADLKIHDDSHQKMVEVGDKIFVVYEGVQETAKRMMKEFRANWITIGIFAGFTIGGACAQLQFPWWGFLLSICGAVGLLQLLSRQSWDFVRRWFGKWRKAPAKSKSDK
jgi:hypothetical protein